MTRITLVLLAALTLAACQEEQTTYSGRTDQVRIDRNGDGGKLLFGKPVPGGCLYHSHSAMAFAPHPCPPDAGR